MSGNIQIGYKFVGCSMRFFKRWAVLRSKSFFIVRSSDEASSPIRGGAPRPPPSSSHRRGPMAQSVPAEVDKPAELWRAIMIIALKCLPLPRRCTLFLPTLPSFSPRIPSLSLSPFLSFSTPPSPPPPSPPPPSLNVPFIPSSFSLVGSFGPSLWMRETRISRDPARARALYLLFYSYVMAVACTRHL